MSKILIAIFPENETQIDDKQLKNNYIENYWLNVNRLLKKNNFELHSFDVYQKKNIDPNICIFINMPKKSILKRMRQDKIKTIVILREAALIEPSNYDKELQLEVDYIITYYSSLIDNKKYFKSPSTMIDFTKKVNLNNYYDRKLCTLINSNLSKNGTGELYSHRVRAIRWFEKNALNDFDFYGRGWDKYKFNGPVYIRVLNKIPILQKIFYKPYPSYKGSVDDKIETMSKYKFLICFENANNVDDYVTEKIFDSFCAMCVPIYWGAPNITDIIPKECFIDFRDFNDYEELYQYIKKMEEIEYMTYINAIQNFIDSDKSRLFSVDYFAKSIVDTIKNAVEDI